MSTGDISLAETARRLKMSPTTLRKRMQILNIVGHVIGSAKALNPEQFAAIKSHDDAVPPRGRRRKQTIK